MVQRTLPAPPKLVYQEWLDPESLTEWMCPRPARAIKIDLSPTIGGRLWFDIVDGAERFTVAGQFIEMDRPHRLRFTWSCSTWPDPTLESVVTVRLEPSR